MNSEKKQLLEKLSGNMVRILLAVFCIVLSIYVLSDKVPDMGYVQSSLESLHESRERVMIFSGATLAASTAISLLPNDWAGSLSNTLADMNKYFVFIFAIIFLEELVLIEGIKISFIYIIPLACILYILFVVFRKEKIKEWAAKIFVFGMALVCVIPFSTHFTEMVGSDYLQYVDETIDEASAGSEKIYNVNSEYEDDEMFLDKISNIFKGALQGVRDLFT